MNAFLRRVSNRLRNELTTVGVGVALELDASDLRIDESARAAVEEALEREIRAGIRTAVGGDLRLRVIHEGPAATIAISWSRPGASGTQVAIPLPAPVEKLPGARSVTPPALPLALERPRALLVVGNSGRLMSLALALNRLGLDVVPAASAQAAAELTRRADFDVLVATPDVASLDVEALKQAYGAPAIALGHDAPRGFDVALPESASPARIAEEVIRLATSRRGPGELA